MTDDLNGGYVDGSFEGSKGGFTSLNQEPFNDEVLNSTVVFSGAFSLRLEDTEAASDTLDVKIKERGEFYSSFSIYYESGSAGQNQGCLF